MCTVTFIPRERGFLLGMNRDEHWERGRKSFPPTIRQDAVFPLDEKGGTWIAVNASGIAFAILNRNGNAFTKTHSRGDVIPQLIQSRNLKDTSDQINISTLDGTLPFTLLIFSAHDQQILERIWDGKQLSSALHPWALHHWFSSGLSDERAKQHRSELVLHAESDGDVHSLAWMRRLHQAHGTAAGPFSICVHREEVGSVSYTEITASTVGVTMSYWPGPPCQIEWATARALTLPSLRRETTRR